MIQILPYSGGAVGSDPLRFLATDGPSEIVEIRPAHWLHREVIADMHADGAGDHERLWNRQDPALSALAIRARAHALGGAPLSSEELEGRLRNAIARSLEAVGEPLRPKTERGLHEQRTARVVAYIHAHLPEDLSLGTLADIAAANRFHFARMLSLQQACRPTLSSLRCAWTALPNCFEAVAPWPRPPDKLVMLRATASGRPSLLSSVETPEASIHKLTFCDCNQNYASNLLRNGGCVLAPDRRLPEAGKSRLFHADGPDVVTDLVSDTGTLYPIALWGRPSL